MILDRVFSAASHDGDVPNTSVYRFFDDVLDQRLIDKRQHFFGLGFSGRKKSGSQSRRRKNRFRDAHLVIVPSCSFIRSWCLCGTSASGRRNASRPEDSRPPTPAPFCLLVCTDRFGTTNRRTTVYR